MENAKLNINKTKYRYFMDNVKPEGTAIIYTIPVPKGEEKPTDEFFDRDYPDVKISYKKFIKMIDKTAAALLAYGVKKGDIVTVCHTNTPEIFYMDYALNKIGAIPNYIYPNITADEMKYFIEELDSKFVFVLDEPDIKKNMKKALEGTDIKVISSSVIEAFPSLFKMIAAKKKPTQSVEIPNEIKWADFIKNGEKITKFFYALAPLKSGRLELPRAVIDGFYTVYDNTSQRPQSFGDSFMQFFDMNITNFMGVQKPVLFRSDIETVNVKPIPENYAGKQWVPALILLATSEWEDKNPKFKVGETVARYITIVASGLSENRLPDIELLENPDWKQYPDKPQYSSAVHDGKFVSQETVRVVYIPQKSGKMVLPEIRIPWFNVKTGKTEYAVVESQEIDVAPNAAYENISLPEKEQAVRSEPKEQPKVKAAKKKNNSQNDNKLVVFVAAIIAFISGLIVSFLLFGRKQKSNKKITESDNLKSIRQALDKKDYREVRDSLLQWGQNVFLHERINNLQDLVNMMEDDEFASQCEILNSLLYSHTDKTLDEKVIINALKNAGRKKTRKTDTPLPNLYK